jgi:hypothetical protein
MIKYQYLYLKNKMTEAGPTELEINANVEIRRLALEQ